MSAIAVTSVDPESIDLLIVEDDDGLTSLLQRTFATNPDYATRTIAVPSLAAALEAIEERPVDAILLDLGLPDSHGLATARRVIDAVPDPTAVVIYTAQRDRTLAAKAMALGVQDYVVKQDLSTDLVTRVVKYGVSRARLVHELAQARLGESRERELRRMERLANRGTTTAVSARMHGARSVADRLGDGYETDLVEEYARIVRKSLDERAFRGGETVDEDLRSLAGVLAFLGAGPRDVIELHARCMRGLVAQLDGGHASAALEEGRVTVLQLMGRLASHYRDRAVGAHGSSGAATARPAGEDGS